VRVVIALKEPRPARDLHWLRCRRPRDRAAEVSQRAESHTRIFETVSSRTMMPNEAGVQECGLPGLSSTILFAFFRA